ncbi:sensor histidine kinase [Caulobacter sp. UNC279MFTsu5.1]|uniref:sensor histidine kinase n=1 Tax=Caulobacter sp. UNC279MFTsu5.1 TaxID=1502775 RepID=UPI000364E247|nr:sensor histidine kinase [Caulobacter sp. UNC279MFTsu5.1]SFK73011.1 Two-component sensor histidine kinase, contains HisKA and HATPase domains [Caulobacter sp. UNC279MFTsu5.1]
MDVERREFGDAVVRHVGSDDRLSEAQHRIANNLALIAGYTRLQATRLQKAGRPLSAREACIALEEVAARIETVGELHRLLSGAPGEGEDGVDLGRFLAKLCASLMETVSFAGDTVITHRDAGGCLVRADQATPVALIVSELVTNALKYAHPTGVAGRILVSCRPAAGGLEVEVADDGVGLGEGFDPHREGGLGFRVVRGLARQLGATLVYETRDIGLTVRLTLGADEEHRVIPLWPDRG